MTQVLSYGSDSRALAADQGIVARLRSAFADYRLYLATIDELAQLSDRELADLGLHRASIRDVARQSVYGA